MKIKLNKATVVEKFLKPVNRITEKCVLNLTKKALFTISNVEDGSIILYARLDLPNATKEDIKLNVSNITKLIRVFSCIDEEDIVLNVATNNINFNSKDIKFKYHLLEDGILESPLVSTDKINKLTFDHEFELSNDKLNELLKGSTFAIDTNKVYLYCEDNEVYGELTDRTLDLVDSITFKISDSYTGKDIVDKIPVNFEIFRMLSGLKSDIHVKINTKLNLLMFELSKPDYVLKYIIAPLVK